MSRGSTIIMYRMYKNCKVPDAVFEKAKEAYANQDKKYPPLTKADLPNGVVDLPVIMNSTPFPGWKTIQKWEKSTNVKDVKKLNDGYFLRDEKIWCERIMDWNFCSIFDCLVEHYDLNSYIRHKSMVVLSDQDVRDLYVASNYLLMGSWGKVEPNPFVNILANENLGDSYWKYVYRNRVGKMKNIKIEQDGYKINISCPLPNEDEDAYADYSESNETFENIYTRLRNATALCLEKNDDLLENDPVKYFLVYERWG